MYILVVKNVNILTILIFTKYFAISYFELRLLKSLIETEGIQTK